MTDDTTLEAAFRAALDAGDAHQISHYTNLIEQQETDKTPVPLISAALWYAEHGLHIFPLQPGSKIPYGGTRGCKDATNDAEQIRTWWTDRPDSNIGLATGHRVDVVDIDGATGQKSRVTNWDMFATLHVIATVATPRPGGMHLYVPASGQGNKAGLLPSIDYRGNGGYVVAPPSRTDIGSYRFLNPLTLDALDGAA